MRGALSGRAEEAAPRDPITHTQPAPVLFTSCVREMQAPSLCRAGMGEV